MADPTPVLLGFPVGDLQANCYLVGCPRTREAAVVDPGGDAPRILDTLERAGLAPRWILATHGHPDHVAAARELQDRTNARFAIHPDDIPLIERMEEASAWLGVPFAGVPGVGGALTDGAEISVGDLRLRVLHTPGHSPGSVCLLVEAPAGAGGRLLTGDTLFAGSIGRTDLPGGDGRRLLRSIHERLLALPDETPVLPGHGPETTIGEERRTNFFLSLSPSAGA